MLHWIAGSQSFDAVRIVANLNHIGPQALRLNATNYTLFGVTTPGRVIAVADHNAMPVVLSISREDTVRYLTRRASDRLHWEYASTPGELVQRLAVQGDQTDRAFQENVYAWVDTGLLKLVGLLKRVTEVYYRVPTDRLSRELVDELHGFSKRPADTPELRDLVLRTITQVVRYKCEEVEREIRALTM